MHKYYDFRNIDSVSITLVFILIITVIYILNNFTALLRKECSADEGCLGVRIESYGEAVLEHSPKCANIIDEIHFIATRLHLKFYEEKCIALLKEYPEAVNSPKLPLMYTPFLRACWCGNARVVEYMLKNGADITSCTNDGDTPMFLAVYSAIKKSYAYDPACINILYNSGCNINAPKSHGYTPLHLAAKAGNADLVRWLLVHGADPDRVTKCNKKPVDFAIKYGHKKVVSLLTVCTGDETHQQRTSPGSQKIN